MTGEENIPVSKIKNNTYSNKVLLKSIEYLNSDKKIRYGK
jgi:hypothetical protein